MDSESLSLTSIMSDVKIIIEALDELQPENTGRPDTLAVFIYGIYKAQKEDNNLDLKETLEYSKKNWSDLF
jgi:hypothetical protein